MNDWLGWFGWKTKNIPKNPLFLPTPPIELSFNVCHFGGNERKKKKIFNVYRSIDRLKRKLLLFIVNVDLGKENSINYVQ